MQHAWDGHPTIDQFSQSMPVESVALAALPQLGSPQQVARPAFQGPRLFVPIHAASAGVT